MRTALPLQMKKRGREGGDHSFTIGTAKEKKKPALLLHFDVNKTIVQSDSVQQKTVEDGVRDGISELFWGVAQKAPDGTFSWDWDGRKPSCDHPEDHPESHSGGGLPELKEGDKSE